MHSVVSGHPFKIYGDNYPTKDGTAERDYVHVSDLAHAHICALQKLNKGYNTYNIGLESPVSVNQIIEAFERINGIQLNFQISPRREGDLAIVYANTEKANKELDWQCIYTVEDMCKHGYNYALANF